MMRMRMMMMRRTVTVVVAVYYYSIERIVLVDECMLVWQVVEVVVVVAEALLRLPLYCDDDRSGVDHVDIYDVIRRLTLDDLDLAM